MIKIITEHEFRTIQWKNGLGETTELAINDGGDLAEFSWRISMANVVEDGVFSDFSGYFRHLVLIEGNSLLLQHDDSKIDKLTNILDVAHFDGGCKTLGNLPAGAIRDLNIITRKSDFSAKVTTYQQAECIALNSATHCFVYALSGQIQCQDSKLQQTTMVPEGALLQLSDISNDHYLVSGQQLVIVYLMPAA